MRKTFCSLCVAGTCFFLMSASTLAQEPGFSREEARELEQLIDRFDYPTPDLPTTDIQKRLLLNRLREWTTPINTETETLTVCEVIDNPHLKKGDTITLTRLGSSANLWMTIVRDEGLATESNPWRNTSGGNVIIVNPTFRNKAGRFSPEGVGNARVDPHDGGGAEDHDFSMRRNTRVIFPNDCGTLPGDEDMIIFVPPHATGTRHGGHAVASFGPGP